MIEPYTGYLPMNLAVMNSITELISDGNRILRLNLLSAPRCQKYSGNPVGWQFPRSNSRRYIRTKICFAEIDQQ